MTHSADPGVTGHGVTGHGGAERSDTRTRIRVRVFLLTSLALGFYLGFIALTFYRSHH